MFPLVSSMIRAFVLVCGKFSLVGTCHDRRPREADESASKTRLRSIEKQLSRTLRVDLAL